MIKSNQSILEKIKNIDKRNMIAIFFLSIVISCCMFTFVNQLTEKLLPFDTVKLTIIQEDDRPLNEIWLYDPKNTIKEDFKNIQDFSTGIWDYRDTIEDGYSEDMAVSYGQNVGSSITLNMVKSPTSFLKFWANINSGVVNIEANGVVSTIDLNSDLDGGEIKYFYPFQDSTTALAMKALVYIGIVLIVFFIIISSCYIIGRNAVGTIVIPYLHNEYKYITTIFLFVLIYLYNITKYIRGIPNYLAFGDQVYYWNTNPDFYGSGLKNAIMQMVSFRGYLSNLMPYLSQCMERVTKIDASFFYLAFMAIVTALLLGYIMPKIYELLTGKKANYYQVLIFFLIFVFFWRGLFYTVLMDLLSTTCLFAFILCILYFIQNHKSRYAFVAGLMISSAVMYRLNYMIFLKCFCVAVGITLIVMISRKYRSIANENWYLLKKYMLGIIVFLLGIVLVAVPQYVINSYHGHVGLFPYDQPGSWVDEGHTLAEYSASYAFSYLAGYPYPIQDAQISSIRQYNYQNMDDTLNINQILDAYASKPLDALHTIIKKGFTGFDLKIHLSYPSFNYQFNSFFYCFSMINYIILGSALFALINKRLRCLFFNKKEYVLLGAIFSIIILPQTFVHVEWRYFLPGYVLIYYIVSFKLGLVFTRKEIKTAIWESNYFYFVSAFCVLASMVSLSLYY